MKFMVIEGLDGSGKSTQINMLQDFLKNEDIPFRYVHFPRTDSPVYGELIARFLRGELGDIDLVNPYLVALIYAGDRLDASETIKRWLNEGFLVIVDRYVYSNIAYQCAKVKDVKEKQKLKQWILDLEFDYNQLPKPDLNIYLDVPFEFTKNRLQNARSGNDRDYLNGKADIHEADLDFQMRVRDMYLELSKTEGQLQLINCADKNEIISPEAIFLKMKNKLVEQQILNIRRED
jgi:dTMP kinase